LWAESGTGKFDNMAAQDQEADNKQYTQAGLPNEGHEDRIVSSDPHRSTFIIGELGCWNISVLYLFHVKKWNINRQIVKP